MAYTVTTASESPVAEFEDENGAIRFALREADLTNSCLIVWKPRLDVRVGRTQVRSYVGREQVFYATP